MWEDDEWEWEWRSDKKKKTKAKGKPKAKPKKSLLGANTIQDFEEENEALCYSYMTDELMAEWNAYYAELKGKDPMSTTYTELWNFYELWDGDFLDMSNHVINQLSIKEAESDTVR